MPICCARSWIPNAEVVEGYEAGLMQADLDTLLSREELLAIVAYIKSL